MKIVFFGTPAFAVPALKKLHERQEVVAVVTQPDRKKNRGQKVVFSEVKEEAVRLGIPVYQPENVRDFDCPDADLFVVVAYGQIFSEKLLQQPKYGCFNIHASLLPKYRGAAPIQRAIEAGEAKTGICIMKMEKGLDTGDVLLREEIVCQDRTCADVEAELSQLGARLIVRVIDDIEDGTLICRPQEGECSYAKRIGKEDFEADLASTFVRNLRKIRAFGYIRIFFDGRHMKIFGMKRADIDSAHLPPHWKGNARIDEMRTVAAQTCETRTGVAQADVAQTDKTRIDENILIDGDKIYIRFSDGFGEITELQPENSKRMPVKAYLAGRRRGS